MNVIFDTIYAIELAFLFCNNAMYICIQFFIVPWVYCWLSEFGAEDDLVIYLTVAAHVLCMGFAHVVNPWAAPMVISG